MNRLVPADGAGIREAARALAEGRLVAFPTETVYGLGAVVTDDRAVARIFVAKRRPHHNPLIAHAADRAMAAGFAWLDERAERLADAFWPGPLTLVLPLKSGVPLSPLVTAGLSTVGVRVPAHPVARRLIEETGLPVAAPSANRSGRVSPTTAEHVLRDLGDAVDLVVDAGPCPVGLESTIVDLSEPDRARLLRPGGLSRERIEALIGPLEGVDGGPVRAPGLLGRHYAPRRPLRLGARRVAADEALLAFGPEPPAGARVTLNLSPRGDLAEAAANLFAMLRRLDEAEVRAIAVMPIPAEGLGEAINDRLRRAALPVEPVA
ncbi:MAG TPA: threonylcarbamoyl-AMP synthase [Rhodospirillales bacterium]|nr:threonylcarbamoyl-AMP synthase [Rhodospirillales bacterium]